MIIIMIIIILIIIMIMIMIIIINKILIIKILEISMFGIVKNNSCPLWYYAQWLETFF
jgi:hypothetical protein